MGLNEITGRQQFDEISPMDIVLIVRKPISRSKIHHRRCGHLNTEFMNLLKPESANSAYYHCRHDRESQIREKYGNAKWCRSCKNRGN